MKIEEVEEETQRKEKELESALKLLKSYVKARDEGIAPKNPELEGLLDAMKQEQGSPENITLPKVGTDRAKSETIIPKPFFVIKTATSKGEKIFVNICGSPKIPAPAEWEEGIPADVAEALKANNDSESLLDIPNIRFPVSCLDPVATTDHGGKPCRVFDIVYNSSIAELTMSSKKMKLFLIEMATSWISQKYNLELNTDFKLPNMRYKGGEVACHQIRANRAGPLVSEVPCDSDSDPSFPLLVKRQGCKAQVPNTNVSSSSVPLDLLADSASHTRPTQTTRNSHEKISETSCDQLRPRSESTTCNSNLSSFTMPPAEAPPSANKYLPSRGTKNPSEAMSLDKSACNGETNLAGREQFAVFDMPMTQPLIELGYSSRPVDTVIVMISYPQLKVEDLEVFVTFSRLLIKTKFHDPVEVSNGLISRYNFKHT